MYVIGLDGQEYNFNPKGKSRKNASKLHVKCRKLLKKIMPMHKILEEVYLPDCALYLDFYIPSLLLAVEVHGQQHTVYNRFFYKHKSQFVKAQQRDEDKKRWCNQNNIDLIELNYNEDINEWEEKIRNWSSS